MKTLLEQLNYQPPCLLPEEIEFAENSICGIFHRHPLHKTRTILWEFYQAWLRECAEDPDEHNQTIAEMIIFYNDLINLTSLSFVVGYNYESRENI